MSEIILVLTEGSLTDADVEHIIELHSGQDVRYHVLIPVDTDRNMLVSLVDHLSLGEVREALDSVLGREPEPVEARAAAQDRLRDSVAAFRAAGAQADGTVIEDDPLPALRSAVQAHRVMEIVVVTLPHAVEDTLHTDWASRAREALEVPVLHIYAGTNLLG